MTRISATVCTLNEAENIRDCILAIQDCGPDEIVVVDASSEDGTAAIAKSLGARVIVVPRRGLSSQRNRCVLAARNSLVALFDADHRPEPEALTILAKEIEEHDVDGVEAQILSTFNRGYWDWAMEMNFKLTHNQPGPRSVIGTPCLYRRETLLKVPFDEFFTGPSDDTDLSYRLVSLGYKIRVGTAVVRQVHRTSFVSFYRKWLWYGSGDAQFLWKHPQRATRILFHQLVRYPILKSAKAIQAGHPALIPFFVMAGWLRFIGLIQALLILVIVGNDSVRIRKT